MRIWNTHVTSCGPATGEIGLGQLSALCQVDQFFDLFESVEQLLEQLLATGLLLGLRVVVLAAGWVGN
ncbi:MAG: hypothetical protein M3332_18600 [Actinomycetota bacterium]|nr:hypothetical protein [Actinomycetota bacterium]